MPVINVENNFFYDKFFEIELFFMVRISIVMNVFDYIRKISYFLAPKNGLELGLFLPWMSAKLIFDILLST